MVQDYSTTGRNQPRSSIFPTEAMGGCTSRTDRRISDTILCRAADLFGITVADLTGRRRTPDLVQARFAAAYALRRHCQDMPLCAIGAALGGRDHSTIINALRRAEALARNDPEYDAKLRSLLGEPSPPEVQRPFGAVVVPSPPVAATAQ